MGWTAGFLFRRRTLRKPCCRCACEAEAESEDEGETEQGRDGATLGVQVRLSLRMLECHKREIAWCARAGYYSDAGPYVNRIAIVRAWTSGEWR